MKQKLVMQFIIGLIIVAGLAVSYQNTSAGGGSPTIDTTIETNGCEVRFSFQAGETGNWTVILWDDGSIVYEELFAANSGDTILAIFFRDAISSEGSPAPGLGLEILFNGTTIHYDDPVAIELDTECDPSTATRPTCNGAPPNSVGGALVATSDIYYDAMYSASSGQVIEAGKTVRVISRVGDWYLVHFACSQFWLPAEVLGPNFDDVWQGRPLPSNAS